MTKIYDGYLWEIEKQLFNGDVHDILNIIHIDDVRKDSSPPITSFFIREPIITTPEDREKILQHKNAFKVMLNTKTWEWELIQCL